MTAKLTLYSRRDCCLCDEMKAVIEKVAAATPFEFAEFDIDTDDALRAQYNDQVPVLFVDGRKAFKYRVTVKQLARRLNRKPSKLFVAIAGVLGRGES